MSYKENTVLMEEKEPLDLTLVQMAKNTKGVKLQKENKTYNRGHFKIRDTRFGSVIPLVVGSVIIYLMVNILHPKVQEEKEDASLPSFNIEIVPTYQEEKRVTTLAMKEIPAVKELPSILQIRQNMIQHYCAIYGLNYDLVYNKIVELTDNFSNENFVYHLTIDGVICKGKQPYADNEEELFIYTIRIMSQDPSRFGFDDSIYVENTFESDVDYTTIIDHYARVFQIDRNLIYAIMQAETSFNSPLFLNKKNPAGIKIEGEWVAYPNLDQGIIEFCAELLKYHFQKEANTLEEIRDVHAPLSDGNFNWLDNVTKTYNQLVYGTLNPFSDELYELWRHEGEEVYSVYVGGEQEVFFQDRELYQQQRSLN